MTSRYRRVAKFTGVYYYESTDSRVKGRADACYMIRFQNQYGQQVWEKVGWKSEGYSAQFAANVRNERIRMARHGTLPEGQKHVTFKHVWKTYDKWLDSGRAQPEDDRQRYKSHLEEPLAHIPLHLISPMILENLKESLFKKGLAPATVKHCLVIVRQVINKARDWGMFSGENPVSKIKLPKLQNARERFLTKEEAEKLIAEIISPQLKRMAIVSLETGLRAGEVTAMRWRDVNFDSGIINVRGKGGYDRQAYLTGNVRKVLDEQPKGRSGFVFESKTGGRISSISNGFVRATYRAGLNKPGMTAKELVSFHTLRHTFASWLAIEGVPLLTIKELLGHKSLVMTERYAHLCPDHKRNAASLIGRLWSPDGCCPGTSPCPPPDTEPSGQP